MIGIAVSGAAWNVTHSPIDQLSWRDRFEFSTGEFPAKQYEKFFKMV